jgi:hypothetical protein
MSYILSYPMTLFYCVCSVVDPTVVSIANGPDNAGKATALSVGQAVITSTFDYEGETHTTHAVVTVTP